MSGDNPYQAPSSRLDVPDDSHLRKQRRLLAILIGVYTLIAALSAWASADRLLDFGMLALAVDAIALILLASGGVLLVTKPRTAKYAFLGSVLLDGISWWQWEAGINILFSTVAFLIASLVLRDRDHGV